MKVKLLGSSTDGARLQYAMSYVVDDAVAIDAGCLGFAPIDAQRRVEHVFLSHTHLDHIGSLPLFVENVYRPGPQCPTIYGSESVLQCLRQDVFNDRVWPDMIHMSDQGEPFLRLEHIESGKQIRTAGLMITPIAVDHIVPTLGFIVEDDDAAVAFVSDTGPTEAIWTAANNTPNLKAVFLEASFPNSMEWLAIQAAHLTPAMFLDEYRKLNREVPVIVIHIKAAFRDIVLHELNGLNIPQLEIGAPDTPYVF